MRNIIRGIVCACALLLVGAGAASAAPQSKPQAKCINTMNKGASKVQAAQGKLNSSCIKEYVSGKVLSADACIAADAKMKVAGKQAKLNSDDSKKCSTVETTPTLAYTGGVFTGTTAAAAELNLVHDIYGNPLDPNLAVCATNPSECLCQRQVNGRINKLFRSMSKIFLKCKNPALAIGKAPFVLGAGTNAEIGDCIDDAGVGLSVQADTKTKVASATGQLADTAQRFCFTTPADEFGAGACAGFHGNPTGLAACIRDQVKCRFCNMYKAADALGAGIDCGAWSGAAGCPN
jgi:hypothetical protein